MRTQAIQLLRDTLIKWMKCSIKPLNSSQCKFVIEKFAKLVIFILELYQNTRLQIAMLLGIINELTINRFIVAIKNIKPLDEQLLIQEMVLNS